MQDYNVLVALNVTFVTEPSSPRPMCLAWMDRSTIHCRQIRRYLFTAWLRISVQIEGLEIVNRLIIHT